MTATAHTHVGYRKASGSEDQFMRSARNQRAGKRHALVADERGERWFRSLCGEVVYNETSDIYGDPISPNVKPVCEGTRPVECKRCLKVLKTAK